MPDDLHSYYLSQMGIERWVLRTNATDNNTLSQLAADVSVCTRCPLHRTRTHTVFSRGSSKATWMIIGEASESHENEQDMPFVGRSGVLLNKMLVSAGLPHDDVYMTNVIKCRSPENQDPNHEEVNQCFTYLEQQISLIKPAFILALGQVAGSSLLGSSSPLHAMRQTLHHYQGIPVIVSYHPASLLHNPSDKKHAYHDLLTVKRLLT